VLTGGLEKSVSNRDMWNSTDLASIGQVFSSCVRYSSAKFSSVPDTGRCG